jgi:hypothetical protein
VFGGVGVLGGVRDTAAEVVSGFVLRTLKKKKGRSQPAQPSIP